MYAVTVPSAPPKKRAPGTLETVRFVVDALIDVIAVVEAFVIVALVTVAFAAITLANSDVDEALIPFVKFKKVVVAFDGKRYPKDA